MFGREGGFGTKGQSSSQQVRPYVRSASQEGENSMEYAYRSICSKKTYGFWFEKRKLGSGIVEKKNQSCSILLVVGKMLPKSAAPGGRPTGFRDCREVPRAQRWASRQHKCIGWSCWLRGYFWNPIRFRFGSMGRWSWKRTPATWNLWSLLSPAERLFSVIQWFESVVPY